MNNKHRTTNLDIYHRRSDMENDTDIDTHVLFSQDKVANSAHKRFLRLPLTEKEKLKGILSVDNNFYEIVPPERKVKPYFDLEMEYDGLTRDIINTAFEEFVYWLACEIRELFGITLLTEDLVILDSCRENKLSFHLVINQKIIFASVEELKMFISYLWSRFENPKNDEEKKTFELLTYKTPKGEQRFIFDLVPYGKCQNFRLINQSKKGKGYVLENLTPKWSPEDTLIRVYNDEGIDCTVIDREKLEGLDRMQKKVRKSAGGKSTRDKKSIFTPKDETFNATGRTLLEKYNYDYDDLKNLPRWKSALYLIPNTVQGYAIYRNVGMAIKQCGAEAKDFIEWTSLSTKYDKNSEEYGDKGIINEFNSYLSKEQAEKSGRNCYGYTYLKGLAKQLHPEYFRTASVALNDYFNLNTDGMKVIQETSKFVSMVGTPDGNNILDDAKNIILHAYLGRGKTTAIKRLLKQYKTFLFLSPRQTFARFLASEFECDCYLDGNYTSHRFVISVESLWRLEFDTFDVICLDESESIFAQLSSSTMNGRQLETWEKLMELMKNAKKVVFADAFLTNRTLDIARHSGDTTTVIQNQTPAVVRKAKEISPFVFCQTLLNSIKDGKKNYVCYSSANRLVEDMAKLNGAGMENPQVKDVYDNSLIYHAKVDDKIFQTLKNINSAWKNASMVVTSPTNTIGCSYSPEGDADFDAVWINAYPTCVVRDTFQTQMRVRHLRENEMVFCVPTKKSLNFARQRYNKQYDLFNHFESDNKEKQKMSKILYEEILADKKSNANANVANADDGLDAIAHCFDDHSETPEVLKRLFFANLHEQTLSTIHYEKMFRIFLEKCGYGEACYMKQDGDDTDLDIVPEYATNYASIPEIEDHMVECVQNRIKQKEASRLDKLQMEQYWFHKIISKDLPLEHKEALYDRIYQKSYIRPYLLNLAVQKKGKLLATMLNDLDKGGCGFELNKMRAVQMDYIQKINKYLEITDPVMGNEIIERESVIKCIDYLTENRKQIQIAFGIRDQGKSSKYDVKGAVQLVAKIYMQWCGMELKSIKNGKKSVEQWKTKGHTILGIIGVEYVDMF
mgnify:CR=1 FL=1